MWLITLVLGAVIIWLIRYWVNNNFSYWEKQGIAYSKSSPFTLLYDYLFNNKGLSDIQNENYTKLNNHRFAGYFEFFTPALMIRDPELIYRICVKDFSHFSDRNSPTIVNDLFTGTLVNQTGDSWRRLRQKMVRSFTSNKLITMFKPIKESCEEVVDFIEKKKGDDIQARDFMFKFVVNVIGNVAFGLKVDALNEETEENNEFLNISKSFFKPSVMLMLKFMITTTMPNIRKYIRVSMIDDKIDSFFKKLVQDMIAHRERTGEVRGDFLQLMLNEKKKEQAGLSSDFSNTKTGNSSDEHLEEPEDKELLEQLNYMKCDNIEEMSVFTDECIVSQTFNFISGGGESTAATLSFVLYELSVNPNLQKKVQDEVDNVLSKNEFNYQAVKKLKYMEQFINESMRLHSVFPFLSRVCNEDYTIPETNVVIEKGSYLVMPLTAIQNDAKNFPNPKKFDPERFGDTNEIPPGASLIFGVGPRMCIAKRLAMVQMKILLATILQKYTVLASNKNQLPLKIEKSSVFQHVVGGLWVKFQRR